MASHISSLSIRYLKLSCSRVYFMLITRKILKKSPVNHYTLSILRRSEGRQYSGLPQVWHQCGWSFQQLHNQNHYCDTESMNYIISQYGPLSTRNVLNNYRYELQMKLTAGSSWSVSAKSTDSDNVVGKEYSFVFFCSNPLNLQNCIVEKDVDAVVRCLPIKNMRHWKFASILSINHICLFKTPYSIVILSNKLFTGR